MNSKTLPCSSLFLVFLEFQNIRFVMDLYSNFLLRYPPPSPRCSVVSRGPSHCDTTFLFSICKALEDSLESAADMEEETEGAEMEEIVEEAEEEGNDEMESEQEE